MSLIPYLLQKCLSANAIMNKMSVPRSSAARTRPVRPSVCRAVPSVLQCAAPFRPVLQCAARFSHAGPPPAPGSPIHERAVPNKKAPQLHAPEQTKKAPQRDAAEPVQDGGYLLSRECSTIGAGGLNFSKMADTYSPANAVPSARAGLTSLFGMGRGGTPLPNRLNYGF